VSYSQKLGPRGILVGVIVGLAAATAGAARWTPWSPLNSCLFCGSAPRDIASAAMSHGSGPRGDAAIAAHGSATAAHHAAADDDGPLPAIGRAPFSGLRDSAAAGDDSRRDWQPWGTAESVRVNVGESSVVLGGLSRLSASSIAGGGSTVRVSPAATAHANAAVDNAPAVDPPAANPPSPAPPAPRPSGPPSTAPVTTPVAVVPTLPPGPGGFTPNIPAPADPAPPSPDPTDTFHHQDDPAPAPFVPPAPTGPLGPNDPAATVSTAAVPAATPEPASLMLVATGLVAVVGELRRRRVI
jgi:hypothetical protein